MEELVEVFNEYGFRTGEQLTREEAIKQGKLIKAFQIWIINEKGEVLIQKRSSTKVHDAGMIDLCSGHVQAGETETQAVIREIKEELGTNAIKDQEFEEIIRIGEARIDFTQYGRQGNYIVPWYCLKLDRKIPMQDFDLQESEVEAVRWAPYGILKYAIESGKPNIRIPYNGQIAILMHKLEKVISGQENKKIKNKIIHYKKYEDPDPSDNI